MVGWTCCGEMHTVECTFTFQRSTVCVHNNMYLGKSLALVHHKDTTWRHSTTCHSLAIVTLPASYHWTAPMLHYSRKMDCQKCCTEYIVLICSGTFSQLENVSKSNFIFTDTCVFGVSKCRWNSFHFQMSMFISTISMKLLL